MQRASDRWISIALSVLLHGALLGLLLYGWMLFRSPPPPAPTLAIEATVVDAKAVKGLQKAPQPAPPPPAPAEEPAPQPEAEGPPEPTPEELQQREAQRRAAEEAQQQKQAAAEKAAQEKLVQEKAAQEKAAQAQRQEDQRRQDEQKKLDQQKKLQEQKKLEDQKKADARAAQEKKAAEAKQRAAEAQEDSDQEADLKRSLAAEEHSNSRPSAAAVASWTGAIAAKINRAWLRPPTAKAGIECVLNVTQAPGGQVTAVSIGQCNGDQAVRESIEAAVYRASPLPAPPDPSLFDRNLTINFKPD
jgi:colicin import membrane protein